MVDKFAVASVLLIAFTECIQAQLPSVASLPTGNYYYEQTASEVSSQHNLFFRKSGFTVIGVEIRARNEMLCFRGITKDNGIVNVTHLLPPYHSASEFESIEEEFDLTNYQSSDRFISDSEQEALRNCIHALWR